MTVRKGSQHIVAYMKGMIYFKLCKERLKGNFSIRLYLLQSGESLY